MKKLLDWAKNNIGLVIGGLISLGVIGWVGEAGRYFTEDPRVSERAARHKHAAAACLIHHPVCREAVEHIPRTEDRDLHGGPHGAYPGIVDVTRVPLIPCSSMHEER